MNAEIDVNKIPKRILNSLLLSVSAGVVPRIGAPYIAIGRQDEISALLSDLEQINEGAGTMRFIIGRYGSGKSFLIQLIRGYALEQNFITADADLSPERRLYGTSGSGVATYRELIKNMASKSSPDGAALPKIIARWIDMLRAELVSSGVSPDSADFSDRLNLLAHEKLREVEDMVGGYTYYINAAHRLGMKIYIATLLPMHRKAADPARTEDMRCRINEWLRGNKDIDGLIDFEAAVWSEENHKVFEPVCDSGDHLHPSVEGARRMAYCIPEEFYKN